MSFTESDLDVFEDKYGVKVKEIGRGAHAKVFLTTKDYVIKKIRSYESFPHPDMICELSALRILENEPNIIKLYDFIFHVEDLYMVLEKAYEDAFSYVTNIFKKGPKHILNYQTKIFPKMAAEIVLGVNQMQRKNILHRDIKPKNILRTSSGFKVADFGLARSNVCPYIEYIKEVYTITYRPPELIHSKNGADYGFPADIWALGVTLFELYTGKFNFLSGNVSPSNSPTSAVGGDDPNRAVVSHNMNIFLAFKKNQLAVIENPQLRNLLSKILMEDPKERLTIDQILKHPYLRPYYSVIPAPLTCFQKYLNGDVYFNKTNGIVDKSVILMAEAVLKLNNMNEKDSRERDIILESSFKVYAGLKYLIGQYLDGTITINTMMTDRRLSSEAFESKKSLITTIVTLLMKFYGFMVLHDAYSEGQITVLYYLNSLISFTVPANFVPIATSLESIDQIDQISDKQSYITDKDWLKQIIPLFNKI